MKQLNGIGMKCVGHLCALWYSFQFIRIVQTKICELISFEKFVAFVVESA